MGDEYGCVDFAEFGRHICGDSNPNCPIRSKEKLLLNCQCEKTWQESLKNGKIRMLRIVRNSDGTQ